MVARPFTYAAATGGATGRARPKVNTDRPMLHDVCAGWSDSGSNVSRRTAPSSETSGCSDSRPPTDHGVPSLRPPVHCPTLAQRLPVDDAVTAETPLYNAAASPAAWKRRTTGTIASALV